MVTGTAALVWALGRHVRQFLRPLPPATTPPEAKVVQPDDYQNKAIMPDAYAAKARTIRRPPPPPPGSGISAIVTKAHAAPGPPPPPPWWVARGRKWG